MAKHGGRKSMAGRGAKMGGSAVKTTMNNPMRVKGRGAKGKR